MTVMQESLDVTKLYAVEIVRIWRIKIRKTYI